MPIYEYTCKNCDKVVELLQKYSERGEAPKPDKDGNAFETFPCPVCSKKELSRILSKARFRSKGLGFYSPKLQ